MFFFVWFFIPETKGLSLESMDELFGSVPHGPSKVVEDHEHHARSTSPNKGEVDVTVDHNERA
jgi:hypothetical protein